jgi:hypothetical protein
MRVKKARGSKARHTAKHRGLKRGKSSRGLKRLARTTADRVMSDAGPSE